MTKLKYVVVALAGLFCASAHAQSSPPQICHLGSPCVVDANGVFVGVGAGPVMHVFNGVEYMLTITADGFSTKTPLFYWPGINCKGPPLISDAGPIHTAYMDDTVGDLYAAGIPVSGGLTAASYSFGLNGTCGTYPTIGNVEPLAYATVVDHTVAKSWVPPFGPLNHRVKMTER